jgi:hypothetical protein
MQRLLDIMTGLRKVREDVPREEAIVNVLSERRDMVSCNQRLNLLATNTTWVDFLCVHRLVCLRERLQGSAADTSILAIRTKRIKQARAQGTAHAI